MTVSRHLFIKRAAYAPEVIPWKDGGVIIAWEDYTYGDEAIYGQKYTCEVRL
jgi:hypothetical protein